MNEPTDRRAFAPPPLPAGAEIAALTPVGRWALLAALRERAHGPAGW